ncbi:MAG TPA: F0F1 ATP synthase subunit epsilon [Usitatibacter sp.]|jgi:F-type H+-transporting ATPase subunit epsilon|nr:F0F1 ATP synthase subunit epsilon [Usitatibacter sp.]
MAKTLQVDIVSAEQQIFSGPADMVIAPGEGGELGILPEHMPLLTRVKPGTVRIRKEGAEEEVIYVSGGMMEVQPDRVTILADTSVRAHDLDEAKAMEAVRQAKEALENKSGAIDFAKAQAELAQNMAQLAAIRKLRERR